MALGGEDFCINCGHCFAVCLSRAISLETMKAEECVAVSKNLLLLQRLSTLDRLQKMGGDYPMASIRYIISPGVDFCGRL